MINDKIKRYMLAIAACVMLATAGLIAACASGGETPVVDRPPQVDAKTYSVVYTVNDESGGFLRGDAEQQVPRGGDGKMVTAVENIGYRFVGWSDGMTAETRRELNVTEEKCVTAIFERNTYIIEYSAGQGGSITGDVKQKVQSGDNTDKVIAVPDVGYRFVKWSDGKTDAERIDVDIIRHCWFFAEFEFLYDGKGTQAEPYLITDYAELCNVVYYPNSAFLLTADLDISSEVHEPIFIEYEFNGVFDGGGHTIFGLNIDNAPLYPSLFGRIGEKGHVKDLSVADFEMRFGNEYTSDKTYVGALASESYGIIENISANGEINCDKHTVNCGGLIGKALSGAIVGCEVSFTVTAQAVYLIGGIAVDAKNVVISECKVNGIVNCDDDDLAVGGLAAYYHTDDIISLDDNAVTMRVDKANKYSGMFIECRNVLGTTIKINNFTVVNTVGRCSSFTGLINSAYGVDATDCNVENSIGECSTGTGFIYNIVNSSVANSSAIGNISATGNAYGFCFNSMNTGFVECSTNGEFSGRRAVGFVWMLLNGKVERCFSKGKVVTDVQGAGFVYRARTNVSDCYSQCDVIVTNTDPDNENSTYIGGFICRLGGSGLSNCYYSGSVRGSVYSLGAPGNFPREYFVGAFIGKTTGTNTIENCHVLHAEKGYATDVVANSIMSTGEPDIVVYNELQSMYELADILNGDRADVWKNVDNACPEFVKTANSQCIDKNMKICYNQLSIVHERTVNGHTRANQRLFGAD